MKKLFIVFLLFAVPIFAQPSTWSDNFPYNRLLIGNGQSTIVSLPIGANGQILMATGGKPIWTNADTLGVLSLPVLVSNGGTGATTLTAHGLVLGQGTSAVHISASGTSGQLWQSGGASSDGAYTTATYPATTTANRILFSSATNTVGQISTANNGVLVTNGSGVPSIGTFATSQPNIGIYHPTLIADTVTASLTLINTPLAWAIASNEVDWFDATLFVNTDSVTGAKFAITVPASGVILAGISGNSTGATAFTSARITSSGSATIAFSTWAAGVSEIHIHGKVTNSSTAGSVTIKFESVTAGNVTILSGSTIIVTRVL
jgi:hypothetical protein